MAVPLQEVKGLYGMTDREVLYFIRSWLDDGHGVKWAIESIDTHFKIQKIKQKESTA